MAIKDSLYNLKKRIGFTDTELKIIAFLAIIFLAGLGIKYFTAEGKAQYQNFNYNKTDSLFTAAETKEDSLINKQTNDSLGNSLIRHEDYKPKLKTVLKDKSININKAGIDELSQLPGIGIKTAQKIIESRKQRGRFTSIDELLDVKGIGEKKLEKIKKIVYIE